MRLTLICLAGLAALGLTPAVQAVDKPPKPGKELRIVSDVDKRVAQFAPTPSSRRPLRPLRRRTARCSTSWSRPPG